MTPVPSPFRILSIDGGGVGGIVPARVLQCLADRHPDLIARADLVAGTSTGGLIALGLARGVTPADLADLYLRRAGEIFSAKTRRWPLFNHFWARYSPAGLRSVIDSIAGPSTLHELGKAVLVPVLALKRPGAQHVPSGVFLSTAYKLSAANRPTGGRAGERYRSGDWQCTDVALATSAGPSYFPAHRVQLGNLRWTMWDGGVVANNPALAAVGEVLRLELAPVEAIRILSVGTGYRNMDIPAADWGELRIVVPLVHALLDASVGSAAFLVRQFFSDRAVRVNVPLSRDYEIDDAGAVRWLDAETRQYCANGLASVHQPDQANVDLLAWLRANW